MTAPLRPKKSLGQHFLRDEVVLGAILEAGALSSGDRILEIGAGDGTLTAPLALGALSVVAVETDPRCVSRLRRRFPEGGRVEIIAGDILRFDLDTLGDRAPLKVFGNLPYNIAGAVLDRLLDRGRLFSRLVLMFQREVAARLAASPGTKAYGSLSLATQFRSEVSIVRTVPPAVFSPPPKVDSALVLLVPRRTPLLPAPAGKIFSRLVRGGFRHRRKTLVNSLAGAGETALGARLLPLLGERSLPAATRAEELTLDDYLRLAEQLDASPSPGPPGVSR